MTEQELRSWYNGRTLPEGPIQIHKSTTIGNASKFVESQFRILEHNAAPKMREPRLLALMEFKKWMEENGYAE